MVSKLAIRAGIAGVSEPEEVGEIYDGPVPRRDPYQETVNFIYGFILTS